MKRRRAISLIEFLAVASGCSLVLGLSASLIHQAMRTQIQTRHFLDVERSTHRLSRQFRRDVHAAESASNEQVGPEQQRLLWLTMADGSEVGYRRSDATVVRIQTRPGEPTRTEEYSLGSAMTVAAERLADPPRWRLAITTEPPRPSEALPAAGAALSEPPVNVRVEAVVGRDLRYRGATGDNLP